MKKPTYSRRTMPASLRRILLYTVMVLTLSYWLIQQLPEHLAAQPAAQQQTTQVSTHLPFGYPVMMQDVPVQLLENRCYDVGYSNERADPLWVSYRLTTQRDGQLIKRPTQFITDTRTQALVVHAHYNRSGYDRGHMAPNKAIGELCDDQAQLETFYLSNIAPQSKALNQRWWERLERVELQHFTQLFPQVWVIDGPVFGANPVKLPHGPVDVPEAFYKIFLAEKQGQWHVLSFLVPQSVEGSEPLSQFRTQLSQIMQATGIDFLPQASDVLKKDLLESQDDPAWQLDEVDLLSPIYGHHKP